MLEKVRIGTQQSPGAAHSASRLPGTYVAKFMVEQELFRRLAHVIRLPSNKLQMETDLALVFEINASETDK